MTTPVASLELKDGFQLTLYQNRVVHEGGGALEIVPLAHLASVRVAFERDAKKLSWAVLLLARLLPLLAGLLGAIAAALGVLFFLGATVLTLSFAAAQRVFATRGRNPQLVEFAQVIGEQLAMREN